MVERRARLVAGEGADPPGQGGRSTGDQAPPRRRGGVEPRSAGVDAARRAAAARRADAGRAEAAHRALALVPLARRRRRRAGAARGGGVRAAARAAARPEGSALDAAAVAGRHRRRAGVRPAGFQRAGPAGVLAGDACAPSARPSRSWNTSRRRSRSRTRSTCAIRRPARSSDRSRSPRPARSRRRSRGRARRRARGRRARTASERAALRAFRDLLEQEAEECAQITTSEVGKPIRQSRNEIRAVLERIDWNIEHVGALTEPRDVTSTETLVERVTYEPVGVVAHVSAWNYPYFVGLGSIVPGAARRATRCVTSRRSTRRSPGCGSSTCCTDRVCRSTSCT